VHERLLFVRSERGDVVSRRCSSEEKEQVRWTASEAARQDKPRERRGKNCHATAITTHEHEAAESGQRIQLSRTVHPDV
jgi:hypothetical protein